MSSVAVHKLSSKRVAIKVISKAIVKRYRVEDKLCREIEIHKELLHPHVTRMFEAIETDASVFVVMEFIERGEVLDYIRQKGKLQEKEARRLFQQLISAVEYCHFKRFVHRDLYVLRFLLLG
jgi:5'-AMP-activated protein kinase catalytic alpha subunit